MYSWKVIFESENHLFELILSACSATEEDSWKAALQEQSALIGPNGTAPRETSPEIFTSVFLDLKPAGPIFGQAGTLARRLSIQRAATVGTRNNTCQVIIRNTHRPNTSHESREPSEVLNRSRSLLTTHRTIVLAPKRSDRVRLEQSLADVYSKEVLPFPGMTGGSRSGHLIRSSAGTIARKLSLANMHGHFSRRSLSLSSVPTKQSIDRLNAERDDATERVFPAQSVSIQLTPMASFGKGETRMDPEPAAEHSRRESISGLKGIARRGTLRRREQTKPPTREMPVADMAERDIVENLDGRKRWSNPLGLLKNFSSEGMRHLLYSSKAT